jgi:hypothetical protein
MAQHRRFPHRHQVLCFRKSVEAAARHGAMDKSITAAVAAAAVVEGRLAEDETVHVIRQPDKVDQRVRWLLVPLGVSDDVLAFVITRVPAPFNISSVKTAEASAIGVS